MKKFLMAAIMALVSVTASAQLYVGGGMGLEFYTTTYEGADNSTAFGFSLLPEATYYITDEFAVGAQIGMGVTRIKDIDETRFTSSEVAYCRYDFLNKGIFKLGAEGAIVYQTYGKNLGAGFGLAIRPVAQFAINDKFSVLARFSMLSFVKNSDSAGGGFTFGLGVLNGSSTASIGVAYKF